MKQLVFRPRAFRRVVMGISVPLAVLVGIVPALAHGGHGFSAPVIGTVTSWSGGVMQIQTQSAAVSLNVTSASHVQRLVSGSLRDVASGQHVDADFVKGTTTIGALRIEAPAMPHTFVDRPSRAHVHAKPSATHVQPKTPKPGSGTHPAPQSPPTRVSGQVTSVGAKTVTLRVFHGQSVTYNLSDSVKVTKILNGTTQDLAVGETVQAVRGPSGNAQLIVIQHA